MSTVLTDRMQIMSTSKSRSYRRPGRVALVNTSDYSRQRSSMAGALPLTVQQSRRRSQLREVPELVIPANDRRLYNPDPVLTYKRLSGRPARVVAPSPKSRAKTLSGHPVALLSPSTLLFQNPPASPNALNVASAVRSSTLKVWRVLKSPGLKNRSLR